jgi:cobalt-zinc-cadmium efflux system outer membrane protein
MKRTHTNLLAVLRVTGLFLTLIGLLVLSALAQEPSRQTLDELIAVATQANPHVRAAKERWSSASQQILQTYAPVDPIFSYSNVDSPDFPLYKSSLHTIQVEQALQFPGKALFQADLAKRNADIARLAYESTIRDVKAQVEIAYYQFALDTALGGATQEQTRLLSQVVKVTEVGYQGSKNTQADVIAAQLSYITALQQLDVYRTNVENDRTQLNMLLYRRPDEPLLVDDKLNEKPLILPLDDLISRAAQTRQEILQAALTERNSNTATTLAKMEYLPDYSITYYFDDYLLTSGAPAANRPEDHSLVVGFNVPIYFWWHQREDVQKSLHDLTAARHDLSSIKNQTAAAVTTLYRTALVDYRQAEQYRDSLIPTARMGFQVALIAYENGKIDFSGMQNAYQQLYAAQVTYLQFENQYLAQRVALEQTVGSPLPN